MLYRNVCTWPDVDLSASEERVPGSKWDVNVVADTFIAKGNCVILLRDVNLGELSDGPEHDELLSDIVKRGVVRMPYRKYDLLTVSYSRLDDHGFFPFLLCLFFSLPCFPGRLALAYKIFGTCLLIHFYNWLFVISSFTLSVRFPCGWARDSV